jgi:hypothetical protein
MGYENVIASNKARATHKMYDTRVYRQWIAMKSRCYDQNNKRYKRYGGRGITVCKRWRLSFAAFYEDMGDCPSGMSLDRIDNDKGYSPSNCRWSTPEQQANNRKTNVFIEHDGLRLTIAQWARHLGLPYHWIKHRYTRGYKPPELFSVTHLPYKVGKTFKYKGKEVTMKELSSITGVKLQTLYARLYAGKPLVTEEYQR